MSKHATISRQKVYPSVAHRGPAWRWIYLFSIDGAPVLEYGTGLTSLRRMLRERHGIGPDGITTDWEAGK